MSQESPTKNEHANPSTCDVLIIGAGILGLINALQYAKRGMRVLVIDNLRGQKRSYKVGESLLIFSTMFLRTIGGLDEFLEESFPKHGVWFVHGMEGKTSFEDKPEFAFAGRTHPWVESIFANPLSFRCELKDCHFVRPEAEDLLADQVRAHPNITLIDAARVKEVTLGEHGADHTIGYECLETRTYQTIRAPWIIDCSGRSRFLAKRFKHSVDTSLLVDDLQTTAVWAQFKGIDDGMFEAWRTSLAEGIDTRRDLSTVHLWGEHYWIWVIRLAKGRVSIGVTFDQRHPPEGASFKEQFWSAIRRYPLLAGIVCEQNLLELRSYKDVQYMTDTFVSAKRYAMVGDSASIVDAYYSQGMSVALVTSWHVANVVEEHRRRGRLDGDYIDRINESTRCDWLMLRNMIVDKYSTAIADGRFFLMSHIFDWVCILGIQGSHLQLVRWLVETQGDTAQETRELEAIREALSRDLYYSRSSVWWFCGPERAQRIQGYLQRKIGERARWRLDNGVAVGPSRLIVRPPRAALREISSTRLKWLQKLAPLLGPIARKCVGPASAALFGGFLLYYAYDSADTMRARLRIALGRPQARELDPTATRSTTSDGHTRADQRASSASRSRTRPRPHVRGGRDVLPR